MSTIFQARARIGAFLAAALAIVSWAIALGEAVTRFAVGPLCSASQDAWAPLSHCPACIVAVATTLLSVGLVVRIGASSRPERVASR